MKAELRRPRKNATHTLSNAISDLAFLFRCLCFCSNPPKDTSRRFNSEHIKYVANTSLILLFGLLHTADGIVTYFGLKFNYADEVNPVLLFFAGTMGLGLAIFALKLLCVEFIALLYVTRRNIGSCWGTATLFSADAFYSWVVSNNIVLVVGV